MFKILVSWITNSNLLIFATQIFIYGIKRKIIMDINGKILTTVMSLLMVLEESTRHFSIKSQNSMISFHMKVTLIHI